MSSATRRWMEDTLTTVKDYFDRYLDVKIDVIANERQAQVPHIQHTNIGETKTMAFPRIELLPDRTEHDYGFPNQPLTYPWLSHNLVVWVEYSSGSLESVRSTLMRIVEAINRITEDDDTYGGQIVDVRLGVEDYTPMMEDQENKKMIQGVSIQLTCRTR